MFKINKRLLPIKAHYFFFMAAMGPILPQLPVYGKHLGIPADTMGLVTSFLPLLYILAKPAVGYLADYFSNFRKTIFMSLIIIMTLCYAGFYFVPNPIEHTMQQQSVYNFSLDSKLIDICEEGAYSNENLLTQFRIVNCYSSNCGYLTNSSKQIISLVNENYSICLTDHLNLNTTDDICDFSCYFNESEAPIYTSTTFWSFVILLCLGTIGFNVTNCISDAVCFDVLGDNGMKYGAQRVWGTIGFGLTALLSGVVVNYLSDGAVKNFTPALIIMTIFSGFDLISVTQLKLPNLSSSESIWKEVLNLLRRRDIVIFLVFATIAGVMDSFIIYYMFWHLEDVAAETGYMDSIKLIEGCVVAAECLGGELLFFMISGKILKKIGYVHCLTFCFFAYSVRLFLISTISNPWFLVPIELFMQGATFALCYTCIVAYASAIAPPGTSATIQGLVAGMDDGVGYAIGSLIGGQVFQRFGGSKSFKMFSLAAFVACIAHIILRPASKHHTKINQNEYETPPEQEKA